MPRRPLVTERDVMRARREGRKSLDAVGALVTPAARDAATAHGITIVEGVSEKRSAKGSVVPTLPRAPRGRSTAPGSSASTATANSASASPASASPSSARTSGSGTSPSSTAPLRIVVGADHGGVAMKDALLAYLRGRGATVHDLGTFGSDAVDYPDFAIAVARTVAGGGADLGIMVDGAGIGSCMAANKVPGVRAALCYDVTTASNAREHNNANLLTLGGTLIGLRLAQEIVKTFVDTPFGGGRHAGRVAKIDALDSGRAGGCG